jgi:hypothetical protein
LLHGEPCPWPQLEWALCRDPARRGLASWQQSEPPLVPRQLEPAARDLAAAESVGIVTGFCVADMPQPAAETDGPPGALFLARALSALGIATHLLSDRYGYPLLERGAEHWGLDVEVLQIPLAVPQAQAWVDEYFRSGPGARLTHLVAIERAGPSHTSESLAAQCRPGPAPLETFEQAVPPAHRGRCHNMRGVAIDHVTAPAHLLFDAIATGNLPVSTIGVGDGGNEIGMGSIPWETLTRAIASGPADRIVCRVATRWTLIAGVSDWGGYALGLAAAALRASGPLAADWDCEGQRVLIGSLVAGTDAVDGVTRLRESTVDGLPLDTYLQPLAAMRQALGYAP